MLAYYNVKYFLLSDAVFNILLLNPHMQREVAWNMNLHAADYGSNRGEYFVMMEIWASL